MQHIAQDLFTYWPRPLILHNRNGPASGHALIGRILGNFRRKSLKNIAAHGAHGQGNSPEGQKLAKKNEGRFGGDHDRMAAIIAVQILIALLTRLPLLGLRL